ncbi:hypothetical protein ACOME3_003081 [Neoechinorhynchus agilis]
MLMNILWNCGMAGSSSDKSQRGKSGTSFFVKSHMRSKFSCSVSSLNIFADFPTLLCRRQSRNLRSSFLNLKKETFSVIFEYNGRKYQETLSTSDDPLRDRIKLALSKYFEKVKHFSLYVNNSNTPLPDSIESSRYVAGLVVIVKGIDNDWKMRWDLARRSLSYNISDSSNHSRLAPSNRNLDFINENDDEDDSMTDVGASLDEMVPAALHSINALTKRQHSTQTAHRRMTFAQNRRMLSEEVYNRDDHFHMIEARLKSAECMDYHLTGHKEDLPPPHEDWQTYVSDNYKKTLSEDDKAQQDAIWELIQTEVSFIRKMRTMITTFIHTVRDVLNSADYVVLQEVSADRLFTNIEDVYQSNLMLWKTYMQPIYENLRVSGKPMDPTDLKPAFTNFAEVLKPYFTYVIDQNSCTEYFKSLYKTNEVFRRVIEWCEARSSERLSFLDLFIQPMQRLTKYKLLLEAILKRTCSEEQAMNLSEMVSSVDAFVKATNAALKCQEQFYSLAQIMQRSGQYESYSAPVELNQLIQDNYSSSCRLNLLSERNEVDRTVVHHGILKMKDNKEKIDVYCYLLSDMLILLRWRKNVDKLKFARAPIKIDNIDVYNLNDDSRGTFALIVKRDFGFVEAGLLFFSHQSKYWVKCIEAVKREYLNRESKPDTRDQRFVSSDVVYSFQKTQVPVSCINDPSDCSGTNENPGFNSHHRLDHEEQFDSENHSSTDQGTLNSFISTASSDLSVNSSSLFVRLERPRLMKQNSIATCYSSAYTAGGIGPALPASPPRNPTPRAAIQRSMDAQILKRDDSMMSNCSKKSSSGVSSSSSSLIHTVEEV